MIRLHVIFVALLVFLTGIVVRLFYIQALAPDNFSSNDYLRTVRIVPQRGEIVDRNGEPFVTNETTYVLFAQPKDMIDKNKVIQGIDEVTHVGGATLEARLDMTKQWVPLVREVTFDQKKALEGKNMIGIGFDETSRRFYPEASLAAHLTGIVGKDKDGDSIGYFGIEGYYNKDLEGLPGILKTERDILGKPIIMGTQNKLRGENGRKLVLTIDKSTQAIAKEKLKKALNVYRAKSGCVTVADPMTMEILALTCLPDFDPVTYYEFSESEFKNPVISNSFEPGSIFKPLIVASALEKGSIKPDEEYDETGPVQIGKYAIRTWNNQYHGKLNITGILENSSNVGMVYIGSKLGNENLHSYLNLFGLGNTTGVDLQGEAPSYIKPQKLWYPIDYATVTFGQGIAVTQIQMLTAFSSLINGGWIMRPYVVKSLESDGGEVKKIESKKLRRVISEETSNIIKEMLKQTVKHGEAKYKIPKGYDIGGKTGTAQIALQGTYDPSKTTASFIGFAPVNKPRFIVLVFLNQPEASQWASETAAPTFFEIAKELIVEYNIAPR